ncbi:MAG: cupin domain-containing protein [Bacteroidota bacterium]|nr:cupin domain-containing protein [Bacteroidota bacterium]
MIVALIIILLLLLPIFYNLLVPFKQPDLNNYFLPGQTFTSKAEGITQTIIRQEGDKVYGELTFEPQAAGPPEHLHYTFDESGTVIAGTLSAKIDGEVIRLNAGERLLLKRGIYHRIFNETSEPVIFRSDRKEDYIPVAFAYSLAQLYPLIEHHGKPTLKMIARIAVLDDLFDSVPAGPPPVVFKVVTKIIKPYARLLGVTPYDEKSRPK